jgi:hypothetical protein
MDLPYPRSCDFVRRIHGSFVPRGAETHDSRQVSCRLVHIQLVAHPCCSQPIIRAVIPLGVPRHIHTLRPTILPSTLRHLHRPHQTHRRDPRGVLQPFFCVGPAGIGACIRYIRNTQYPAFRILSILYKRARDIACLHLPRTSWGVRRLKWDRERGILLAHAHSRRECIRSASCAGRAGDDSHWVGGWISDGK